MHFRRCTLLTLVLHACLGGCEDPVRDAELPEAAGGAAWAGDAGASVVDALGGAIVPADAFTPPAAGHDACSVGGAIGEDGSGVNTEIGALDASAEAGDAGPDAASPDSGNGTEVATDPGMFTGLWLPPGMNATYVVDQSEVGGASSTSSIPGCINQRSQLGSNYCGSTVVERIGTLTMAQGNTFAIRYQSEASVPSGQYFKVTGGDGSGIPAAIEVSLSTNYADFTLPPVKCRGTSIPGLQTLIVIGSANCPVLPQTRYYLNVRVTSPCSGGTCRFKILEPASMTN